MPDAPLFTDVTLPGFEPATAPPAPAHDPLRPGLTDPTPEAAILALTPAERVARVEYLVDQAHEIYTDALATHLEDRTLVGAALLFSGGNDSTVLGHVMRPVLTHAIHANTGIGIEETRQFVRDTCRDWELPLLEKHPPVSYRELCVERGFPGPSHHYKMFQRLKERSLRLARKDLVTDGRKQRVAFIAGRRRAESARRADVPLHEREDSMIWVSPLAMWTKLDMATYRTVHDVPLNEASVLLGMSGECLCGAFAKPNELEQIREHFPATAAEIEDIQAEVAAAGWAEPHCRWGHGMGGRAAVKTGPLCTSCTMPDPLQELIDAQGALNLES